MMDETELDNPREFRLDRPAHHYLHFGWGIHQCLGKYISQVQVTQIVKGLRDTILLSVTITATGLLGTP